MDKIYQLPPTTMIGGEEKSLTLREIIRRLDVSRPWHCGLDLRRRCVQQQTQTVSARCLIILQSNLFGIQFFSPACHVACSARKFNEVLL